MFELQKSALADLQAKKRVDLTPENYHTQIKRFFLLIFLFTLSIAGVILLILGINTISISIALFCLITCGITIRSLHKRIRTTSIKGNTIIINSLDNKPVVTSIRSVRSVKSKMFLGFEWTTFKYKLDGQKYYSLILNRSNDLPFSTETFIKKAIVMSKKEKANRKPGSVATN